ncbi:MAG: metal-dependent hydrolase, partial [Thermoanaerobaculia bacterium]
YHSPRMDTITHGIAGSVLTRTLAGRLETRAALVVGGLAAMVPDLDFLFLSSRLDYLRGHRGWTHSFVFLPVLALGFALLARLVFRGARLSTLWLFGAAAIASHILCDWITSYGTMFFTPFSRTRYSLDWVFILDPVFTGIVLASLLAAALSRQRGHALAVIGAVLLSVYVGFCALLHRGAVEAWKRMDRPPDGARVAALPQFLSPFRWLGLSERDGDVHLAFFDIGPFAQGVENPRPPTRFSEIFASLSDFYPPPERARIRRFRKPPQTAQLAAARALPDVQIYLAFARFPLETVEPTADGGAAITWEDLRFLPWFAGPWGSDGGRLRREPFVYRVRLNAAGQPIERAFVRSSRLP